MGHPAEVRPWHDDQTRVLLDVEIFTRTQRFDELLLSEMETALWVRREVARGNIVARPNVEPDASGEEPCGTRVTASAVADRVHEVAPIIHLRDLLPRQPAKIERDRADLASLSHALTIETGTLFAVVFVAALNGASFVGTLKAGPGRVERCGWVVAVSMGSNKHSNNPSQ